MINIKFDLNIDENNIPEEHGKVLELATKFNEHLNRIQSAGMFVVYQDPPSDKMFVIFVSDWLEAGSQACFAWTSEDRNDVKGFLEVLSKFPQIFCKVIPALPL